MPKDGYDFSKLFTPVELKEINRRAIVEAKFARGEYSSIGQMALEAYGPIISSKTPVTIPEFHQEPLVAPAGGQKEVV
ncbi:hypothetical protein A3A68_02630 [Candidatus Saccharibacteria bacterium RIFCSPLOWO2_01_FULL_48_13]|nr:MAG: hypothetical protein A2884_01680 [Candidatus Saccharibacteria bacterium RIFCSPHIGHO2_01_FULL_48_12]OGL36058.1 MAG: hypothetical protein A3F38_02225 [Candidatus Saccharibacteria bacterium RIFCSPHIGHO2_12_FULL_48_21]OGL37500.1 MAG: hypothetical protein A3A68_02630 [Candidatus Saccharibacteria bacterium RIFCSPLOWO2_01_FULL_48_13]